MDKLATRGRRKTGVRRQALQTIRVGDAEINNLINKAIDQIWPQPKDGIVYRSHWRRQWYDKLEEVFSPNFLDIVLLEYEISKEDYEKLKLLGGPHGKTLYKILKARQ